MKIFAHAEELIGNTPLVNLATLAQKAHCLARIAGKLEYLNPAGSVKDRVAREIIAVAEKSGQLRPGTTLIEPTSGNTGIGLAAIAAQRGYKFIAVMPESMSLERRQLLRAYGAQVELSPAAQGMAGAIARAEELLAQIPDSFAPGQFVNAANPQAHYRSTGPEIWRDTAGQVDIFVACVGSGGTISGVGKYLKEQKPAVKIIAVEPAASPVLAGGKAGPHKIQGIGPGFVPKTLDTSVYDEVMGIGDEDALATAREMGRLEGILVGISSGAALAAALQMGKRPDNEGKLIVALLPDSGERYLSTELYQAQEQI